METFTTVTQNYLASFSHFSSLFLKWGQLIFWSLLTINFAWMCLWYAFDKNCFTQSLSAFLKRFVGIMIFYTLMLNPNWLFSLLETVHVMGKTLTNLPLDPSSVISMGIALGNKTIMPLAKSSLLTVGYSAAIILIAYLVIIFTFLTIALELSLTLIMTTALISISALFLSFSSLSATSNIAKNILDAILGNCLRMLGIYIVVGAGSRTIQFITNTIPVEIISFDQYVWVVASCLLFWLLAKNLPNQLAKIVSISLQDNQGTESSALAMSAMRILSQASSHGISLAQKSLALTGVPQVAKVAASSLYNAAMQIGKAKQEGGSVIGSSVNGAMKSAFDVAKATGQTASDHLKHSLSKSVGGKGLANSHQNIPGVSERLFNMSERARIESKYSNAYASNNHEAASIPNAHSGENKSQQVRTPNHQSAGNHSTEVFSDHLPNQKSSVNSSVQSHPQSAEPANIRSSWKDNIQPENSFDSNLLPDTEASGELLKDSSSLSEAFWNTTNLEKESTE